MRQIVTKAIFAAIGQSTGCCAGCGRPNRVTIRRGALKMLDEPDEAYWRGDKLILTQTQGRMLRLLMRHGRVEHEALKLMMPGSSEAGVLKVHIKNLRAELNRVTWGAVEILSIRGLAYELVVGEEK